MSAAAELERLRRARPQSLFLRASAGLLALLALASWISQTVGVSGILSARRWSNLRRFLAQDARPYPLRERDFDLGAFLDWAGGILAGRGWAAAGATIAISVLAIVLAGLLSWGLAPFAARTVAVPEPFLPDPLHGGLARALAWRAVRGAARALMILLRAIPEYVLAFLLLGVLGPRTAWPAVLALALHNAGILGRLGADTIENVEPGPLRALRTLGARRGAVLVAGVFPLALGRYLLYFFYRFETCVREATVLGLLGIVSLGYWIQDARSKGYYDEMLLLVALGAALVVAADVVSALARRALRRGA